MGFLSDIKGKVTELADQAKSGELAAKAKSAAESVAAKTNEVADEMKVRVGELAEEHGGKVTDAVHKAGTFVDDKTGGKSAVVTGKISDVTDRAVHTVAAGAESETINTEPGEADLAAGEEDPSEDDPTGAQPVASQDFAPPAFESDFQPPKAPGAESSHEGPNA